MIIGDKNNIAIEFYREENSKRGRLRLFFNNSRIGTFEDGVSLGGIRSQLERVIENENNVFPELFSCSAREAFEEIYEHGYSFFSLGESFDNYEMRAIKNSDQIRIIWKKEGDNEINDLKVSIDEYKKIVSKYRAEIDL